MNVFALDPATLGMLSALVAAGFSLVPALGATDIARNWTAIITLIVASFLFGGFHYVDVYSTIVFLLTAAVYAFTTYKFFLQNLVVKPARAYLMRRNPDYRHKMMSSGFRE